MKPMIDYGKWNDIKKLPERECYYLGAGKLMHFGVENSEFDYFLIRYFKDTKRFYSVDYEELEVNLYYWAELLPLPERWEHET